MRRNGTRSWLPCVGFLGPPLAHPDQCQGVSIRRAGFSVRESPRERRGASSSTAMGRASTTSMIVDATGDVLNPAVIPYALIPDPQPVRKSGSSRFWILTSEDADYLPVEVLRGGRQGVRHSQCPNCVDRRRGQLRSRPLTGSGRSVGFAPFRNDLRFPCLLDPVRALDELLFDQCRDEPVYLRRNRGEDEVAHRGVRVHRRRGACLQWWLRSSAAGFGMSRSCRSRVERTAMEQAI